MYCTGRFAATGTKSFQIDHPLDPTNKYLNHYCAEGPEPFLIYRGHVILDEKGESWVQLPDYFGAISRDPEYQLTCVGGYAPVYVAEEIQNNRFKIAGGRPGLRVSWRVEAVRNDPFVRAYGAPVELDKPEPFRGKYLHPELYGQPKEMEERFTPTAQSEKRGVQDADKEVDEETPVEPVQTDEAAVEEPPALP